MDRYILYFIIISSISIIVILFEQNVYVNKYNEPIELFIIILNYTFSEYNSLYPILNPQK